MGYIEDFNDEAYRIITYHCKKGQTLRLNKICSDNSNFDKRCKELEIWSFKKVCIEKNGKKTGFTGS